MVENLEANNENLAAKVTGDHKVLRDLQDQYFTKVFSAATQEEREKITGEYDPKIQQARTAAENALKEYKESLI